MSSSTQAFLDLESRAYWAAVTWDTTNSLISNLRTSLTSGMNGACAEPAWRLARAFLVDSFHPNTEDWRTNGFEVSDESASRIVATAAVCKRYIWKNVTSLKEALREGVDEDSVLFVWKALLDALRIFKTSIRPLLDACERRLHFLDQRTRLLWYEVNLQYHLGILNLVETLETARRHDLLMQIHETREDAEHESFNILKFGIENTYTIYKCEESGDVERQAESITASLVAIDPFHDHVIIAVRLMNDVINRKYRQGKIKHGTYSHLSSILVKALAQLPQSSKVVRNAQENLQRSLHKTNDFSLADAKASLL